MRFTYSGTGDREFEGPPVHRGALSGFTMNERKVVKARLKLDTFEQLDSDGVTILYYLMSIRREDSEVLPLEKFGDLMPLDFDMVAHPFVLDQDDPRGSCRECNMVEEHRLHRGFEPAAPDPTGAPDLMS